MRISVILSVLFQGHGGVFPQQSYPSTRLRSSHAFARHSIKKKKHSSFGMQSVDFIAQDSLLWIWLLKALPPRLFLDQIYKWHAACFLCSEIGQLFPVGWLCHVRTINLGADVFLRVTFHIFYGDERGNKISEVNTSSNYVFLIQEKPIREKKGR